MSIRRLHRSERELEAHIRQLEDESSDMEHELTDKARTLHRLNKDERELMATIRLLEGKKDEVQDEIDIRMAKLDTLRVRESDLGGKVRLLQETCDRLDQDIRTKKKKLHKYLERDQQFRDFIIDYKKLKEEVERANHKSLQVYERYENKRLECEKQKESLATFRGGGDSAIKDYAVENSILQYKLEKAEKQLMAARQNSTDEEKSRPWSKLTRELEEKTAECESLKEQISNLSDSNHDKRGANHSEYEQSDKEVNMSETDRDNLFSVRKERDDYEIKLRDAHSEIQRLSEMERILKERVQEQNSKLKELQSQVHDLKSREKSERQRDKYDRTKTKTRHEYNESLRKSGELNMDASELRSKHHWKREKQTLEDKLQRQDIDLKQCKQKLDEEKERVIRRNNVLKAYQKEIAELKQRLDDDGARHSMEIGDFQTTLYDTRVNESAEYQKYIHGSMTEDVCVTNRYNSNGSQTDDNEESVNIGLDDVDMQHANLDFKRDDIADEGQLRHTTFALEKANTELEEAHRDRAKLARRSSELENELESRNRELNDLRQSHRPIETRIYSPTLNDKRSTLRDVEMTVIPELRKERGLFQYKSDYIGEEIVEEKAREMQTLQAEITSLYQQITDLNAEKDAAKQTLEAIAKDNQQLKERISYFENITEQNQGANQNSFEESPRSNVSHGITGIAKTQENDHTDRMDGVTELPMTSPLIALDIGKSSNITGMKGEDEMNGTNGSQDITDIGQNHDIHIARVRGNQQMTGVHFAQLERGIHMRSFQSDDLRMGHGQNQLAQLQMLQEENTRLQRQIDKLDKKEDSAKRDADKEKNRQKKFKDKMQDMEKSFEYKEREHKRRLDEERERYKNMERDFKREKEELHSKLEQLEKEQKENKANDLTTDVELAKERDLLRSKVEQFEKKQGDIQVNREENIRVQKQVSVVDGKDGPTHDEADGNDNKNERLKVRITELEKLLEQAGNRNNQNGQKEQSVEEVQETHVADWDQEIPEEDRNRGKARLGKSQDLSGTLQDGLQVEAGDEKVDELQVLRDENAKLYKEITDLNAAKQSMEAIEKENQQLRERISFFEKTVENGEIKRKQSLPEFKATDGDQDATGDDGHQRMTGTDGNEVVTEINRNQRTGVTEFRRNFDVQQSSFGGLQMGYGQNQASDWQALQLENNRLESKIRDIERKEDSAKRDTDREKNRSRRLKDRVRDLEKALDQREKEYRRMVDEERDKYKSMETDIKKEKEELKSQLDQLQKEQRDDKSNELTNNAELTRERDQLQTKLDQMQKEHEEYRSNVSPEENVRVQKQVSFDDGKGGPSEERDDKESENQRLRERISELEKLLENGGTQREDENKETGVGERDEDIEQANGKQTTTKQSDVEQNERKRDNSRQFQTYSPQNKEGQGYSRDLHDEQGENVKLYKQITDLNSEKEADKQHIDTLEKDNQQLKERISFLEKIHAQGLNNTQANDEVSPGKDGRLAEQDEFEHAGGTARSQLVTEVDSSQVMTGMNDLTRGGNLQQVPFGNVPFGQSQNPAMELQMLQEENKRLESQIDNLEKKEDSAKRDTDKEKNRNHRLKDKIKDLEKSMDQKEREYKRMLNDERDKYKTMETDIKKEKEQLQSQLEQLQKEQTEEKEQHQSQLEKLRKERETENTSLTKEENVKLQKQVSDLDGKEPPSQENLDARDIENQKLRDRIAELEKIQEQSSDQDGEKLNSKTENKTFNGKSDFKRDLLRSTLDNMQREKGQSQAKELQILQEENVSLQKKIADRNINDGSQESSDEPSRIKARNAELERLLTEERNETQRLTKLSRRLQKEIERLQHEIVSLQEHIQERESSGGQKDKYQKIREDLEVANAEIVKLRKRLKNSEGNVARHFARLETMQHEKEDLQKDKERALIRLKNAESNVGRYFNKLEVMEDEKEALQKEIERLRTMVDNRR